MTIELVLLVFFIIVLFIFSSIPIARNYKQMVEIKSSGSKIFVTLFATAIGRGSVIVLVEKRHLLRYENFVAYTASLSWLYIIAKYISPRIHKYVGKAQNISDIFYLCYGQYGGRLVSVIAILFSFIYCSVQIGACAYLLDFLFEIPKILSVIISYVVISIYSSLGGIRAIIRADLINSIFAITGLSLLCFITFDTNIIYESPVFPDKFIANSLFLSLTFIIMTFYPSFIQRLLLSKNFKHTQDALYKYMVTYGIFTLIIGFIAYGCYEPGKIGLITYIATLPEGPLRGFIILGIVAAIISTADSNLNNATVTLQAEISKLKLKTNNIMLMRILPFILAILNVFIILQFTNLLDLLVIILVFHLLSIYS